MSSTPAGLPNAQTTQETAFNADGIIGATNVSTHRQSPCFVETQGRSCTDWSNQSLSRRSRSAGAALDTPRPVRHLRIDRPVKIIRGL